MARTKKQRRMLKWHKEGVRKGWWKPTNKLLVKGTNNQKKKKDLHLRKSKRRYKR